MAQMILESIQNPDTQHVDSLPDTSRGSSGFGSTGTSRIDPVPAAAAVAELTDLGCNQPMVIPVTLQHTGTPVPGSAMIDSGAPTQFWILTLRLGITSRYT